MSDIMKILVIVNVQPEAATRGALWKKGFLNFTKFTGKRLCAALFFNFIEKETLAQVFSYEFCEISTKSFFTEHL